MTMPRSPAACVPFCATVKVAASNRNPHSTAKRALARIREIPLRSGKFEGTRN